VESRRRVTLERGSTLRAIHPGGPYLSPRTREKISKIQEFHPRTKKAKEKRHVREKGGGHGEKTPSSGQSHGVSQAGAVPKRKTIHGKTRTTTKKHWKKSRSEENSTFGVKPRSTLQPWIADRLGSTKRVGMERRRWREKKGGVLMTEVTKIGTCKKKARFFPTKEIAKAAPASEGKAIKTATLKN